MARGSADCSPVICQHLLTKEMLDFGFINLGIIEDLVVEASKNFCRSEIWSKLEGVRGVRRYLRCISGGKLSRVSAEAISGVAKGFT